MTASSRPFIVELDTPPPSPATAPPVPEAAGAMPALAVTMTRKRSVAGRVLGWAGGAFASVVLGVAAWDFLAGLLARWPLLGMLATGLAALALAALMVIAGREWAALMRLGRVDALRQRAAAARDLAAARSVVDGVSRLYAGREEMAEARRVMAAQAPEVLDGDALIRLAERSYLTAPDQAARRAVESAARKVATATALVPLALVDVAVALAANIAMVRQVAEIYGGRAGSFGSWRVLRRVFAHLAATGAIAVGDDLIGSVAGGGVLAKLSRRFGEGLVNGALTARVGVAAMEVCRPLPFDALPAPKVTNLMGRALAGFLPAGKAD